MRIEIIRFIQKELKVLTSKNFSIKYISQYIFPIISNIYDSNDNKFIIAGPQGVGKSTMAKLFKLVIQKFYKKKVMLLSIDDYYLSKSQRLKLSKNIHPLLITRGVPGTHNIKDLTKHVLDFKKQKFPIIAPTFNKLKDDISNRKKVIKTAEILLLEGWCCGSKSISKKYLFKNINSLEKTFDKNNIWRNYYNSKLRNEYKNLFSLFDKQIFIQAPTFKNILNWRYAQEKNNAYKTHNKNFMSLSDLKRFIQHYEKLTKWMMQTMPNKADMLIKIDNNQKIKKLIFKSNNSHQ